MLNRAIMIGRLVADPEFRQTTAGTPSCLFRIAIDRKKNKDGNHETDFIQCVAWRQTAEFVARYFAKGQMIVIEGQLRNNDYTDNNGVKHYGMDVLIDNVEFGESKAASSGSSGGGYQQSGYAAQPSQAQQQAPAPTQPPLNADLGDLGEFEEILSDGEVPF
jgi:single-strand DNA-binding protein